MMSKPKQKLDPRVLALIDLELECHQSVPAIYNHLEKLRINISRCNLFRLQGKRRWGRSLTAPPAKPTGRPLAIPVEAVSICFHPLLEPCPLTFSDASGEHPRHTTCESRRHVQTTAGAFWHRYVSLDDLTVSFKAKARK